MLNFRLKKSRLISITTIGVALLLSVLPLLNALAYDWPQFNGDSQHSGSDPQETAITLRNVANLRQTFKVSLPDTADGVPVYLSGVSLPDSSTHDVVYVTTHDGHIVALDAHSGVQLWAHQNGPGSCHINNGSQTCYTTSSPAIDPNKQFVYSYGLDGKAHKYAVGSGSETIGNGWPEVATLKPYDEKGSSALSIATARSGVSYLYVANGGYPGDRGDYQGHITAINLADGSQKVFNTVCSDQAVHFNEGMGAADCSSKQTAIWARPGVVYSADTDRIYMTTGNGDYNASLHYWGDTVFALNPDGSGANGVPLDTYTPTNFQSLQDADADIGSTAPVLLPAASYTLPIAVQAGKDAKLRLINLTDMSGKGGTGHTGGELALLDVPQGGEVLTQPAVWVNPTDHSTWVIVTNDNGISALQLQIVNNNPTLHTVWKNTKGGTSPIIANGVLYYASGGLMQALNPLTGAVVWSDMNISSIHWESPIVVNSTLYITDNSAHLSAYTLNGDLSRRDTVGIYRPTTGTFYLKNTNATGFAETTIAFNPAAANGYPVVGDWTGSGFDTIGIFDRSNGLFSLHDSNTPGAADHTFVLGIANDLPMAGRWTATAAHDGAGIFRPSNGIIYLKNELTTGFADVSMVLGLPGDLPIAGDWNGDGVDSPGVLRTSNITFYLSNQTSSGSAFGDYTALLGVPGDVPIAGDWNGKGHDGIGGFRPSSALIYLKNDLSSGFGNNYLVLGNPNDIPIAGHWSVASVGASIANVIMPSNSATSAPVSSMAAPISTLSAPSSYDG